jgi:DNA invertase Pin-like site-specific DNA recombinase
MNTAMTGREYLRVSQDRSGEVRSNEEQHDDNAYFCDENDIVLSDEAYADESISASRYSSKVRGGFDTLLSDLQSGRFTEDVLVLWEASRGSRRVREWLDLIEACEQYGKRIAVTTHDRLYNPANGRDRKTLIEDAADSEYESTKTSLRIRRAAAKSASKGDPHGRIGYGYRREYSWRPGKKGKLKRVVTQLKEPVEAEVIGELFRRLRDGDSLKAIARDFAAREITTRRCRDGCEYEHEHKPGKPFTPEHLRDLALRPMYGGLRAYEPGNRSGRYRGSLDGKYVKGNWPALVDEKTFWEVRALLQDPRRRTSRPGRAKHLLSLIACCDVCGGPLSVTYRRKGTREYMCRERSCVYIAADDLDSYAEQVMLAYLARPDVIKGLRAAPEHNTELERLRAELAEARSELAALRAAGRARKVTVATLLDVEPGLVARVEMLEAREQELRTPPALCVIPPGKDVSRRWAAAPMSARRQVARLLCSAPVLGTLRVGRTPTPGHRADPEERVSWKRY